ncbi:MAG TPA: hypothetical protein VG796_26775 [Verrucomicrobiales bacterium]|nr:hypothetical protein [Verrucomicrobiales bacterium]
MAKKPEYTTPPVAGKGSRAFNNPASSKGVKNNVSPPPAQLRSKGSNRGR